MLFVRSLGTEIGAVGSDLGNGCGLAFERVERGWFSDSSEVVFAPWDELVEIGGVDCGSDCRECEYFSWRCESNDAGGEVDDWSVVVTIAGKRIAECEAHTHRWQASMVGELRHEPERDFTHGRGIRRDEHHRVADEFHEASTDVNDRIDRARFELGDHTSKFSEREVFCEPGRTDQVGESNRDPRRFLAAG